MIPANKHGHLLETKDLSAAYGLHQVLHGIDLSVDAGEAVVLLGANGAGKSTFLRCLSGTMPHSGAVVFEGIPLVANPAKRVRLGLAQVPEGRGTFTQLSVIENLQMGGYSRRVNRSVVDREIERYLEIFPILGSRLNQPAGSLSGGEQQMLAIARALMSTPQLLLLDEPSLGLAPAVTQEVFRMLSQLRSSTGLSMLIVEQNAALSLAMADRAYVLEAGVIKAAGTALEISSDEALRRAYLGY